MKNANFSIVCEIDPMFPWQILALIQFTLALYVKRVRIKALKLQHNYYWTGNYSGNLRLPHWVFYCGDDRRSRRAPGYMTLSFFYCGRSSRRAPQ